MTPPWHHLIIIIHGKFGRVFTSVMAQTVRVFGGEWAEWVGADH
jgi:hypothetical protein